MERLGALVVGVRGGVLAVMVVVGPWRVWDALGAGGAWSAWVLVVVWFCAWADTCRKPMVCRHSWQWFLFYTAPNRPTGSSRADSGQ